MWVVEVTQPVRNKLEPGLALLSGSPGSGARGPLKECAGDAGTSGL